MTGPSRFPPGPFTTSLDYPRYSAGRAIALTAVAGLVGVGTTAIASVLGWGFPSFGYLFETVVWKLVTIGILAWGLQFFEHRRPNLVVVGYRQSEGWPVGEARRRSRKAMVGLGIGLILFVPFSFLGTSAGNPSAYGPVNHASLALVLAQLLVCYPLTVVAEETFFPGMAPTSARTVGAHCICIALVRLSPRTVEDDSLSHSTWNHSRRRVLVDGKCEDIERVALPQQHHFLHRLVQLKLAAKTWELVPGPCPSRAGQGHPMADLETDQ